MKVYVVQDEDREVLGVTSSKPRIETGLASGLRVKIIEMDDLMSVGRQDRPWVVHFEEANRDKLQVWPIKSGFPIPFGPSVEPEGIEYLVYATNAATAIEKVYDITSETKWKSVRAEWRSRQ